MTHERDDPGDRGRNSREIDGSAYAASSSESGGLYDDEGATVGRPDGTPISDEDVAPRGTTLTCALCGDPIEPDQAWMTSRSAERSAHAGCVYRDEPASAREERWEPADTPAR